MSQTVAEIHNKFNQISGQEFVCPITANKGLPGLFLEELLDIPHTSNCLDCNDGELKLFPVKILKNGTVVPKETMAITMLSKDDLESNEFESSKCYKKMSKMLIVPYYRNKDNIQFMKSKIIDKDDDEFTDVYNTMKSDYNLIRNNYISTGKFSSSDGKLLQNRTKGAGHGSTSRAFYLRPEFMKRCIELNL